MKTVVIISGGFHPFHSGHFSLYNEANKKFPDADVYVAATNDTSTRPFPFVIKQKLARLAGVPENRFVQVRSPFRAEEITRNYNPNDTVLIFVRSEKDKNTSPTPGGIKKDGSPSYLQPLNKDLKPMNQHAYMTYLPTIEFGPGITSASEIRAAWPQLNSKRKTAMVMSLYPQTQANPALAQTVVKMLDTAIGTQSVAEGKDIENYHHTGPAADKKAQAHAKKLGNEWGAYRHPWADKWDNLHIVVKKHEAPSDLKGVTEGSSLGYTVIVRGNDFSYSRLKDALSDGHPSPAKVYKNGKFLGTIGSLSKQGVAENQPNQAGIGSNTSVVANTQPQTTTAITTNVAKPSVGTVQTTQPTQPTQTVAKTTPAATTSMSTPPDANVTNLAKRLGIDPKRLQGELQNMQEDYLDEKRH